MTPKDAASLAIINIPLLACIIIAGLMAYNGCDGWGWFLAIGMLCGFTVDNDKKKKEGK